MIDVTVKTLDSQNHVFSVDEEASVRQFKEQISPTVSIPVDQQRLIFRGRVLQDDKKIKEYNVANNTIHVVQRPANQNNSVNDEPPARPSSQAGNRMGDGGGIFITADDGTGAGRNAIIMGAIGLPTFDVDTATDDGGQQPRRSGAQVRLMVGNQMLNRASTLLQQLEEDDAAVASAAAIVSTSTSSSTSASGSGDSPENELAGLLQSDSPMDIDDDQNSIERMISQVVNVSSAAALVASIRQGQPGSSGSSNPPPSPITNQQPTGSTAAASIPPVENGSTLAVATTITPTSNSSTTVTTTNSNQNQQPSPSRRPESPRIRELSTALQDYLALQDRLTPFLRFLQESLRQNREYTETGESQSTQFVFDTVSSILHLLGHSLHAFSEIMCNFSLPPEDRRLTASSSILVEQSTVVRATIPVALPTGLLNAAVAGGAASGAAAAAAAASAASNATAGGTVAQPPPPPSNASQQQHQTPIGISFSMGPPPTSSSPGGNNNNHRSFSSAGFSGIPGLAFSMSASPGGVPLANMGNLGGIPVTIPGLPAGLLPTQMNQQWINPNAASNNTSSASGQPPPTNASANGQQQQQQQQPNTQNPGLPAGLQNLGALLGVQGAAGLANMFGGNMPGGMPAFWNFQPPQAAANNNNNNNNNNSGNQQNQAPIGTPAASGQQQSTPSSGTVSNTPAQGGGTTRVGGIGGNNAGGNVLQNLLRSELNRPQFDILLPCHTHHSSGRSRSNNRNRPAEFRRFINVESSAPSSSGVAEGETVEILIDLVRNSRLVDYLQPVFRDVVLNYLMRGRDPKNPAHVKTCAKGLAKKLLPFLEKFSSKVGGGSETVDISTTYANILTGFLTRLMQKVLGQSAGGDASFKSELINALTELQLHLIQAFKVCYPNSTNVGLLFVNYLVDQSLGGMSIIFRNQARLRLVEHLKQLETRIDASSPAPAYIVYKEAPPAATTTPTESSSGNNVHPGSSSSNTLLRSRCAASFGNVMSSSSTSGIATEASSSGGSTPSKIPCTLPTPPPPAAASAPSNNDNTDDVDIDEVLQLPPSMAPSEPQQDGAASRRCPHSGGATAQGHNHQTDSLASLMRALPSEWTDTVQQDIRRQVDMPAQPAFSPGYNTLFPRKH